MANTNARPTQKNVKKDVGAKAEEATRNPWMKALTRYGYFARGILFATIGFLALQVARGEPGAITDQNGALATIAAQPFGKILLIVIVAGLIGFSLWGFIRAIFDPLERGADKQGILERIGFVISGISYGGLVWPFVQLILGASSAAPKSQTQTTQDITAQILAQPFGPWLIGLVGLLVIGWSLSQVYIAYTAKFQKDFEAAKMNATERKWMVALGRIGIGARGLVFALIGFFLIQAALRADPKQAVGLDGALLKIAQQPEGQLLLIAAAAGLIVFGIYSMLSARWLKVS
ncbi:MAG: DUF1206 domain-containing protein [Chloroflexota bacterium]